MYNLQQTIVSFKSLLMGWSGMTGPLEWNLHEGEGGMFASIKQSMENCLN